MWGLVPPGFGYLKSTGPGMRAKRLCQRRVFVDRSPARMPQAVDAQGAHLLDGLSDLLKRTYVHASNS